MNPKNFCPDQPIQGRSVARADFLQILNTAQVNRESTFTRQAALHWLAVYPGDLQVSLYYAKALLLDRRLAEATQVFKGLCQIDPESAENLRLWLAAESQAISDFEIGNAGEKSRQPTPASLKLQVELQNWLIALQGRPSAADSPQAQGNKFLPGWGEKLYAVRKNLELGEIARAEEDLPTLLNEKTDSPLVALTHLRLLQQNPDMPLAARRSLADFYHQRWPDCLACTVLLAEWLMQEGDSERAVALLHQAAMRDISGQIAARMLGSQHPFRSLWPEHIALPISIRIPASVAADLGWNRLPAGDSTRSQDGEKSEVGLEMAAAGAVAASSAPVVVEALAASAVKDPQSANPPSTPDEELLRFGVELDRLAEDLDRLPTSQYDGRYPVYVLFSVAKNLAARYGQSAAGEIIAEMKAVSQAVSKSLAGERNNRWGSLVFIPDLPDNAATFGLPLLGRADPASLKLSLADLDKKLALRGEMIGALLIVGGSDIVPFHNLPNPVDDPDGEVPSDSPYASRDENYFIPEWPVGRLPDGTVGNSPLLLESLRRLRTWYSSGVKQPSRPGIWLSWLSSWFNPANRPARKGFGYSAAVWRQASFHVYRPVGDSKSVLISPPLKKSQSHRNGRGNGSLPSARLAYFNLHGLADSANWYGQRDPVDPATGPDYPIAVTPASVRALGDRIPQVVFSEACYGAFIQDNGGESLALQFLDSGVRSLVGSTCMSYGAINVPLIAADLLGYLFWRGLLDGLSAGEALQRAKILLASEMHQRQGYLDGEDQKTLISFVLYGDPLAHISQSEAPFRSLRAAKHLHRLANPPPQVKTICDRTLEIDQVEAIPAEVIGYVKQVVEKYLPGMADAQLTFSAERPVCSAPGHCCPTGAFNGKAQPKRRPDRRLVVLDKTIEKDGRPHPCFARLTLNAEGKLVKIVVSR